MASWERLRQVTAFSFGLVVNWRQPTRTKRHPAQGEFVCLKARPEHSVSVPQITEFHNVDRRGCARSRPEAFRDTHAHVNARLIPLVANLSNRAQPETA